MSPLKGKFWNDIDKAVDRVSNRYRLCVQGDLNRWVRDGLMAGMTGGFGVPGENDNGRRVIGICVERGISVSNSYFKHRSLYKHTRMPRGQDGVEVKGMIDLVLVNEAMLRYEQNVRAVRGMVCNIVLWSS